MRKMFQIELTSDEAETLAWLLGRGRDEFSVLMSHEDYEVVEKTIKQLGAFTELAEGGG